MPRKGSAGKESGERKPPTPPHATPARVPSPLKRRAGPSGVYRQLLCLFASTRDMPCKTGRLSSREDLWVDPRELVRLRVTVAGPCLCCLCHAREGVPTCTGMPAGSYRRQERWRSRERPSGSPTPIRRPTGSVHQPDRCCLGLTRELPAQSTPSASRYPGLAVTSPRNLRARYQNPTRPRTALTARAGFPLDIGVG